MARLLVCWLLLSLTLTLTLTAAQTFSCYQGTDGSAIIEKACTQGTCATFLQDGVVNYGCFDWNTCNSEPSAYCCQENLCNTRKESFSFAFFFFFFFFLKK